MKDILTLGEWFEKDPRIQSIIGSNPIVTMLFPQEVINYIAIHQELPSLYQIVWTEILHKYNSRYLFKKYSEETSLDTIQEIKADIIANSLTLWNKYKSLQEVINGEISYDKVRELLGNYNITKIGGYSDKTQSENYTATDTWGKESGRQSYIYNFENQKKNLTDTDISHSPTEDTLTHSRTRSEDAPASYSRSFDGGETSESNYKEFGNKNGEFMNDYYKFILSFPNAVDIFAKDTASCYLVDVYDPYWLYK